MIESNKALALRLYDELMTQGNTDVFDELFSPDFVDRSFGPGLEAGRVEVAKGFAAFRAAFPDARAEVREVVAESDKVVVRFVLHGTHQGEFMGVPATGKAVSFTVIDILRVADNRIVERWGAEDNLGLLRQLGVKLPG